MPEWLTPADVAAQLDVPYPDGPDDARVEAVTAATSAAVERRRSDMDWSAIDGSNVPADIHYGSVVWASILYQQRSSPAGFAGYSEESAIYDALGARRGEV